ncbi:hypothetical protein WMY93_003073 [Mugilogobius chulae]|uniref:Immunoglobulin V-set domain-containing protein n=1 Tax=Mugilogobius chulae TaxID=88201 RepID=A0AAW0Q6A2_9GOBI
MESPAGKLGAYFGFTSGFGWASGRVAARRFGVLCARSDPRVSEMSLGLPARGTKLAVPLQNDRVPERPRPRPSPGALETKTKSWNARVRDEAKSWNARVRDETKTFKKRSRDRSRGQDRSRVLRHCVKCETLTQPDSVTVQTGHTLLVTCSLSYSVCSHFTHWVRQPAGKSLEWIGEHCGWSGCNLLIKDSLKNKFSINLGSYTATLTGQNMQPGDTAVYFCARRPSQ